MLDFKFQIAQIVNIPASGESGEVIGQAHFAHAEDSYLVRYRAADGRAVESWWTEGALAARDQHA